MTNDYDLTKLEQIEVYGMPFLITHRFQEHYLMKNYERLTINILKSFLKEDSVFIDIGAHYGVYSLIASKESLKGKVYSFEPVLENYTILKKNIELNNISNIEAYNFAVSDDERENDFYIANASDSSGFYKHPLTDTVEIRKVNSIKIDNLNLGKVDVIKIDTEGHELQVLKGLKNTIKSNSDIKLIVEFNPKVLKVANTKPEEIIDMIINEFEMDIFIIDDEKNMIAKFDSTKYVYSDYFKYEGFVNLLCVRKNRIKLMNIFSHSHTYSAGAEMSLVNVIDALAKDKILMNVILPGKGTLQEELSNRPVGIVIKNLPWAISDDPNSMEIKNNVSNSLLGLYKDIKITNADIFYTNTAVVIQGAILARILNKKHIWHIREFIEDLPCQSSIFPISSYKNFFCDFSTIMIANSEPVRKSLDCDKAVTLYNTIEFLDEVTPQDNVFSKNADIKISLVGRVVPHKGQMLAVRAIDSLVKQGYDPHLVIVGDGDENYINQINDFISQENLKNNITLLGFKSNYEAQSIIQAADIHLLTTIKSEPFGRVTLEGMSRGKCVIASNGGGTLELIKDKETGLIYNLGDYEDLSTKILYCLKNKDEIKSIGMNAKKFANEKFNKKVFEEATLSIFTQVFDVEENKLDTVEMPIEIIDMILSAGVDINIKSQELVENNQILVSQIETLIPEYNDFQLFKKGRIWIGKEKLKKIKKFLRV